MTQAPSWIADITMEDLERDPEAVYSRLREEAPFTFVPVIGAHVASTAEMCWEITSSPDFEGVLNPSGLRTFGETCLIAENGEAHERLRGMVDPSLHASAVNQWIDGLVRPIARSAVERIENAGRADLLSEYFEPVSVRSLGDLLGLTDVNSDKLRDWFHRLSSSVANVGMNPDGTFANPDGFAAGDAAKAEIREVVDPLLDRLIENPDGSALSHWLHDGMPEGRTRDREEIYPTLTVFLLGSMQEPGHAMAATMMGLLSRPEQLEAVVDDPQLIPRAVAEGLRWVAPLWAAAGRISIRDTNVGGHDIPAGTVVMTSFGSANRDAERYDSPAEYDVFRPPLPHLAFGAGPHACAGIHFANHVCRIGLEELFEAIPNIRSSPEHASDGFFGWAFRGPTGVHVEWEV